MKRKLKFPIPSRPLLKQLIDVYRRHPCLWNKTDPEYKKKEARRTALEKVLMKFHEIYPSGSLHDLKLYLEDLKSSCLRDIDKLIRTSRPRYRGSLHIPKTWYFPLMTFLFQQDYPMLAELLESIDLPKPEDVDLRHPKTVLKMLGRQKKKMRKVTEKTHEKSKYSLEQKKVKILKCILKKYKKLPVLWKSDNLDNLSSSESKYEALAKLLEEYQKVEPRATIDTLRIELEDFRRNHAEELTRLLNERANGNEYEPSSWSFKHLRFLNREVCPPELLSLLQPADVETNSEGSDYSCDIDEKSEENSQQIEWLDDELFAEDVNIQDDRTEVSSPEDNYKLIDIKLEAMANLSPVDFNAIVDEDKLPFIKYDEISPRKRKRNAGISKTQLPTVDAGQAGGPRDRFSVSAENFVCKLRHLELEQRVRAETLIEEVLHLAEFNALNEHTTLMVEDPL